MCNMLQELLAYSKIKTETTPLLPSQSIRSSFGIPILTKKLGSRKEDGGLHNKGNIMIVGKSNEDGWFIVWGAEMR